MKYLFQMFAICNIIIRTIMIPLNIGTKQFFNLFQEKYKFAKCLRKINIVKRKRIL